MLKVFLLGPLNARRSIPGVLLAIGLVFFATLLTQIGGLLLWFAYGAAELSTSRRGRASWWMAPSVFLLLYLVATFLLVPFVAPVFGRVALNCSVTAGQHYQANSSIYCLLNRHYVRPETRALLETLADHMAARFPGTVVTYLDGGFPFPVGLPLLPHKSHQNGRQLDLALFYERRGDGKAIPEAGGWPVGYWVFSPSWALSPESAEDRRDGLLRWRFAWLQTLFADISLDEARNREMLRFLSLGAESRRVRLLFIEPYLASHLGVESDKLRFAGWNAARHDDHIHIDVY